MTEPLLRIDDLYAGFHTDFDDVRVLGGITLSLASGETLGIVGESGCGKSVTAMWIMRLLSSPPAFVSRGGIFLDGENLLSFTEKKMTTVRGNRISMIFQEPMTSLNPVLRVGRQVAESIRLHQNIGWRSSMDRALEMLTLVGIPDPSRRLESYPHEMSGGMRQRVMIAMALACKPELLIADEPTTALDVTIQAQILHLMHVLKEETGTAIMLITHDLGVVAGMADTVAVMYAGKIVEKASTTSLFADPLHPYTHGLLASIPRLDRPMPEGRKLPVIRGVVPVLSSIGKGCAFAERCDAALDGCNREQPELVEKSPGHFVRCFLHA
ncbi:MAG: ABC transporter ATP-binding protein [Candidatus Accumulibacter sp.]|jgi:oligopeptide/dipeptide ABC transporter ATP-binding protein|nr:ABC transporter ATP-binding protein [Accumulibacter sp.]